MHYDIIGDVHGRHDKLTQLMARLGYQPAAVGFIPPAGRCALFLGDLIDPKPEHVLAGGVAATLHAVKAMCDAGHALCLLGNHELNAIHFHSLGPDGEPLRKHIPKNQRMHQGTLDDFPDHADPSSEWRSLWLPWMKQLPFHLDLGGLRAVHATWHDDSIARVDGRSLEDEAFLIATSDPETPEDAAMEILLKGLEVALPGDMQFTDASKDPRKNIRVRWWQLHPDSGIGYDELVFPRNPTIPYLQVPREAFDKIPGYPAGAPPVFFGHYLKPADSPLVPESHNVACLDYAAAMNGPLVAYRWQDETTLSPENYIVSHEL
jgi:hypothetical protein